MTEQELKQLVSRLRRLAGQAGSLETVLAKGESTRFVMQLEAVIAASRAALSFYATKSLLRSEEIEDAKLLERIVRKS